MNDTISQKIIDSAAEVHRILGGPGLLESIYETAPAMNYLSEVSRAKGNSPFQSLTKTPL